MKEFGLSTISITLPWTHNVCPTSASVIVDTSQQAGVEVGVIVGDLCVGKATIFFVGVRVGLAVELGRGVLLGLGGVFVAGKDDETTCRVEVGLKWTKLARLRSKIGLPGPANENHIHPKITKLINMATIIFRFTCWKIFFFAGNTLLAGNMSERRVLTILSVLGFSDFLPAFALL
jgi:hypothetical protein